MYSCQRFSSITRDKIALGEIDEPDLSMRLNILYAPFIGNQEANLELWNLMNSWAGACVEASAMRYPAKQSGQPAAAAVIVREQLERPMWSG